MSEGRKLSWRTISLLFVLPELLLLLIVVVVDFSARPVLSIAIICANLAWFIWFSIWFYRQALAMAAGPPDRRPNEDSRKSSD